MLAGTEKGFPVKQVRQSPVITPRSYPGRGQHAPCRLQPMAEPATQGSYRSWLGGAVSASFLCQLAEIGSCVLKDVDLFWVSTKKLSLGIKGSIHHSVPDSSVGKESACNTGDPGLTPGFERSLEKG